jgi:hypothetical protein
MTIDIDSTITEVHGKAEQRAAHGYPMCWATISCSPPGAETGEVLYARMRKGSAHTGWGAERFVNELVARPRRAGATGVLTLKADSGFWSKKVIAASAESPRGGVCETDLNAQLECLRWSMCGVGDPAGARRRSPSVSLKGGVPHVAAPRLAGAPWALLLRFNFLYEYGWDKGPVVVNVIAADIGGDAALEHRGAGGHRGDGHTHHVHSAAPDPITTRRRRSTAISAGGDSSG